MESSEMNNNEEANTLFGDEEGSQMMFWSLEFAVLGDSRFWPRLYRVHGIFLIYN